MPNPGNLSMQDAIVIGGGFYGTTIAIYLKKLRQFKKVTLIEQENGLLTRASYNNQARIHSGYHYPRSFTTAFRSRINFPRFMQDYSNAVKYDFTNLYAIARNNSKVTARQFDRFCREIGAKLEPAPMSLRSLFEPRLIEDVFIVEEYAFDSTKLAHLAQQELDEIGVEIKLNTSVKTIHQQEKSLLIECETEANKITTMTSRFIFNCTYSGMNRFEGEFRGTATKLKHEITEMALIRVAPELQGLGITVMDGPFFSIMPFPDRNLHTLSHVRYTPHLQWEDRKDINPYQKLRNYNYVTRVDRMLRDVGRYIPVALDTEYVNSLFEVKTVLVKSEVDDGRPILFETHPELNGFYSILGGKIDNVYDVLEKLAAEPLFLS